MATISATASTGEGSGLEQVKGSRVPRFSFLGGYDYSGSIEFEVGLEKKEYLVQRKVLAHYGFDNNMIYHNRKYSLPSVHPSVFEAFLDWIYAQTLPSKELIEAPGHEYFPSKWQSGFEEHPILYNLMLNLFLFAREYGVDQLADDTVNFFFDYHMAKRNAPSLEQIRVLDYFHYEILGEDPEVKITTLFSLFIDLHRKWGPVDTVLKKWVKSPTDSMYGLSEEVPEEFLLAFYKRTLQANNKQGTKDSKSSNSSSQRPRADEPQTAGPSKRQKTSASDSNPNERKPWVMKLCNYHCHPKDGRKCSGLYKDKIYIIE